MTGHGQAQTQADDLRVSVEIRAVNNRYLKISVNCGDRYAALETDVQVAVRKYIRRGSIYVTVRLEQIGDPDQYRINESVLTGYYKQLKALDTGQTPVSYASLLGLPGVVDDGSREEDQRAKRWPAIEQALNQALTELVEMRQLEGQNMAIDLEANCQSIEQLLVDVQSRAPQVIEDYQQRLTDRLNHLLAAHDVNVQPSDVVREVGLFADRCDISEEIVRLRSHIDLFRSNIRSDAADGRKLEFLTQELLREANTIGSKANDAELARCVVDIKTAIERIREMIQNIQ